jgi:hypothetical protein
MYDYKIYKMTSAASPAASPAFEEGGFSQLMSEEFPDIFQPTMMESPVVPEQFFEEEEEEEEDEIQQTTENLPIAVLLAPMEFSSGIQETIVKYQAKQQSIAEYSITKQQVPVEYPLLVQRASVKHPVVTLLIPKGIDSPIVNLHALEVLNLTDDQRNKMQSVFSEMKEEQTELMESMFEMIEQAEKAMVSGGQQNMSAEDQVKMRETGEAFRTKWETFSRQLAERLRQHLTPEQLEQEKQLQVARPTFLPGQPRQRQQEEKVRDVYVPGENSWRPGMPLPPGQPEAQPQGGRFPSAETE